MPGDKRTVGQALLASTPGVGESWDGLYAWPRLWEELPGAATPPSVPHPPPAAAPGPQQPPSREACDATTASASLLRTPAGAAAGSHVDDARDTVVRTLTLANADEGGVRRASASTPLAVLASPGETAEAVLANAGPPAGATPLSAAVPPPPAGAMLLSAALPESGTGGRASKRPKMTYEMHEQAMRAKAAEFDKLWAERESAYLEELEAQRRGLHDALAAQLCQLTCVRAPTPARPPHGCHAPVRACCPADRRRRSMCAEGLLCARRQSHRLPLPGRQGSQAVRHAVQPIRRHGSRFDGPARSTCLTASSPRPPRTERARRSVRTLRSTTR